MSRVRAGAVVAFFAASLLVVVATPWCTRDRIEDAAVWKSALARHIDLVKPHDVVLVHPPWRDDVVAALRTMPELPGGVVVTDAFAPRHGDPFPPIVVVREAGGEPLPRALRDRVDAESARTEDGIEIVRLRRLPGGGRGDGSGGGDDGVRGGTGARAGDDDARGDDDGARGGDLRGRRELSDDLAAATVTVVQQSGDVVPCPWDPLRNRHVCTGLPEWMHVGVEDLPVGGRTLRCTWSHPITGGSVHVLFPRVHLGSSLRLDLALTDGAADNRTAAPIFGSVHVDGKPLVAVSKAPGQRGFATKDARVDGAPKDADVELIVTTPQDGQRHTCFRLSTDAGAP